jgi:hypothetical protein
VPGDYVVAVPFTQTSIPTEVMDTFFGGARPMTHRDALVEGDARH